MGNSLRRLEGRGRVKLGSYFLAPFLKGHLEQAIWMEQPGGLDSGLSLFCSALLGARGK